MRSAFTAANKMPPESSRAGSPPRRAWLLAFASIGVSAGIVLAIAYIRGQHPQSAVLTLGLVVATSLLLMLILLIPWAAPAVGLWSRLLMGAALGAAGAIHLLLMRDHADESTLLGYGFLATGALQILLALLFLIRPARFAAYAVIGLNTALLFLYGVHVYLGLPLSSAEPRAVLGTREQVDLPGLVTKIA